MVLGKNQNIIISFKIFIYKSRNIYVQKRKIHFVRELSPSTFRSLYHERQKNFSQLLDHVEQNIMICQWRAAEG